MLDERSPKYWAECGLPDEIAEHISNFVKTAVVQDRPVLERARRFRSYWESHPDDDSVKKNWKKIERNALDDDGTLTGIFLVWPDAPKKQPFDAIFSERRRGGLGLTVKDERVRYASVAESVEQILDFMRPERGTIGLSELPESEREQISLDTSPRGPTFKQLLEDIQATNNAVLSRKLADFRSVDMHFPKALFLLIDLLREADPSAKYATKQPDSKDAAFKSYVALLAGINARMKKGQFSAIASLANINNPDHYVDGDAIRMAWNRVQT